MKNTLVFRILVVLASIFFGIFSFSLLALVASWFMTGEREIHRIHDIAWGGLGFLILTLGFLVQLWKPETKISPMQQAVAGSLAFVVALLVSADFSPQAGVFLIVTALIVWLHPARAALGRLPIGASRVLLALTLIAAIPLVPFALDQTQLERDCVAANPHCDESHYLLMAATAFGLILAGLVASAKNPGYRITSWCVAGAAFVWGLASILYPELEGSVDALWGWLLIAWAVVFVGAAQREATPTELAPA